MFGSFSGKFVFFALLVLFSVLLIAQELPKVVYVEQKSSTQYLKDKLTKLEAYLKSQKYEVKYISKLENLEGEFLVIMNGSGYSQSEIEEIEKFVSKGGVLIISSVSDFRDTGKTSDLNAILKKLNAPIQFNDDEVQDETNKDGQAFVVVAPWSNGKLRFYSTSSIIVNDTEKVKIIVKAYPTAKSFDRDGNKDAIPLKEIVLVVELTYGDGKVIALGTGGLLSDYDFDRKGFENEKFVKEYLFKK